MALPPIYSAPVPGECLMEGCDQRPMARGLCGPHYRYAQKMGILDLYPTRVSGVEEDRRCEAPECQRKAVARGLCPKHYSRLWRNGTLETLWAARRASKPPVVRKVRPASCSVEDCLRVPYAKGYCRLHYDRFRKNGDPLIVRPRGPQGRALKDRVCTREGCTARRVGRGLCMKHYRQLRRAELKEVPMDKGELEEAVGRLFREDHVVYQGPIHLVFESQDRDIQVHGEIEDLEVTLDLDVLAALVRQAAWRALGPEKKEASTAGGLIRARRRGAARRWTQGSGQERMFPEPLDKNPEGGGTMDNESAEGPVSSQGEG